MAVTTEDVKDVITTSRTDLSGFISDAEALYSEILEGVHSNYLQDSITKYLAAHLVAVSDGIAESFKTGAESAKFQKLGDEKVTKYWLTAEALDSSGKLESFQKSDGTPYMEVL